ncbi:MAG: hypothetical protein JWO94_3952 [Verrucomicrobiaceae bacterium]|nr:hypothetical protein [Verrucomicrobiaceae bacterium]
MTTKQLREWLFTNNKEDQWWLSVSGVNDEGTLNLDQIESRLKSAAGSVKALHISQSEMKSPPWIDVDSIAAQAPAVSAAAPGPASETLGMIALLLPLVGALLNIFWVANMSLLQGPGSSLNMIMVLVVVGSAVLIGVEATQLGIGGPTDSRVLAGKRVTGPVGWAAFTLFMWLFGFPGYMYFRSKFGMKNMFAGAIAATIFFLGTVFVMNAAIESKMSEIENLKSIYDR